MTGGFAGRCAAVVTTDAGSGDCRMIKPHTVPAGRDMAVLANIGYGYVTGGFAGCCAAVVTTDTGSGNSRMVKPHAGPAGRDMTVFANIG